MGSLRRGCPWFRTTDTVCSRTTGETILASATLLARYLYGVPTTLTILRLRVAAVVSILPLPSRWSTSGKGVRSDKVPYCLYFHQSADAGSSRCRPNVRSASGGVDPLDGSQRGFGQMGNVMSVSAGSAMR